MSYRAGDRSESSVIDTIRENPVSAALIGAGIGLLVAGGINASRSRGGDTDYTDYTYDDYPQSGASAGRLGDTGYGSGSRYYSGYVSPYEPSAAWEDQGSEGSQDIGSRVRDQTEGLGHQARYQAGRQARQAQRGLSRAMDDYPLAVGAVAALAGAAVGLLLPSTEYESQVLGEARDTLVHRAQDIAKEARGAAERVVRETVDTAKEEAKKEGLTAEGLRDSVKDKVKKGKQVAQRAAEEAKSTAKEEADKRSQDDNQSGS